MTNNEYNGPDGKVSKSSTTKPTYAEVYNISDPKNADIYVINDKGVMHNLKIGNHSNHNVRFYPVKGAITEGRTGFYYQLGQLTWADNSGKDIKSKDNVWIRLRKQYVPNKTNK
mgnify:CR=1 FL=1